MGTFWTNKLCLHFIQIIAYRQKMSYLNRYWFYMLQFLWFSLQFLLRIIFIFEIFIYAFGERKEGVEFTELTSYYHMYTYITVGVLTLVNLRRKDRITAVNPKSMCRFMQTQGLQKVLLFHLWNALVFLKPRIWVTLLPSVQSTFIWTHTNLSRACVRVIETWKYL